MENNKATHASNSLNKWLRTLVTGKTTHSFRHALADRLRNADCSEEVVAEILGHSRAGMTKNYGKGFSLEIKQKWLSKTVADNEL
jgi:integrase